MSIPALGVSALVVGAFAVGSVIFGNAASLNGINSATIDAFVHIGGPVIPSGPQLVTDTFSGNGPLDGRTADTGQTWTVNSGTFETRGGRVLSPDGSPAGVATVPFNASPGVTTITSDYTVAQNNLTGIVMHAAGANNATVLRSDAAGGFELGRLTLGVFTPWVSYPADNFGNNHIWTLTYDPTTFTYTADRGGTITLTYTLTPAEQATVPVAHRVGLYTTNGDRRLSWNDFTATAP